MSDMESVIVVWECPNDLISWGPVEPNFTSGSGSVELWTWACLDVIGLACLPTFISDNLINITLMVGERVT